MSYEFPKDDRFRKLAARLADAVQVKIWSGVKVGNCSGTYCPMGCLPPLGPLDSKRPARTHGALRLGCTFEEADAFITAFDLDCEHAPGYGPPEWFELGRAYRRRFGG